MTTTLSEPWAGMAADAEDLAAATSAPEVLQRLLVSCRRIVPRATLYLVRQGELQGWGSLGLPRQLAEAQRAFRAPLADYPWLARLAGSSELARHDGHSRLPDYGQAAAAETAAACVRVKNRALAFVLAERGAEGHPWTPEGLGLMVTVARLRLELDVAQRQLRDGREATRESAPAEPAAPPPPPQPRAATAAPPAVDVASPAAPAAEPSALAEAEAVSPEIAAARRFARLVATDIRLYNEETVLIGRRNGDLMDRLSDQIDRGRETFVKRHGGLGPAGLELLRDAYVQVLAGGDATLFPAGCLD